MESEVVVELEGILSKRNSIKKLKKKEVPSLGNRPRGNARCK